MITIITAVPGSGKTLFAVGLIVEAVKNKRPVYSNIDGLKIPECKPAPDDWRDTPEGSLVIYDEAQQEHLYPSTAHRGEVKDERLRAMEVHRHTGHDLVFISQSPSFLHHHIRKLAGEHIHLYRAFGMKTVTKYVWQHVVGDPNDRGEQGRADSHAWKFPKEHFKLYKSASLHTHKFKMPKKLAFMLGFIALVASFMVYNARTNEGSYLFSGADAKASEPSESQPVETSGLIAAASGLGAVGREASSTRPKLPASTNVYDWSDTEQATPVAGCISSATKCQCFSDTGQLLKMAYAACMSAVSNPLPRTILVGSASEQGQGTALPVLTQEQPAKAVYGISNTRGAYQ
ncbi:zonular occludens toxin domain-containing protein [Ectopseudomonas mendocina]